MFAKKSILFVLTLVLLQSSSVLLTQGRQTSVELTEADVANLADDSVESRLIRAVSAALAADGDLNDFDEEEENDDAVMRDEYIL